MTPTREEPEPKTAVDDTLIERVAKGYAPSKAAPSARVGLEKKLWSRIERRRRRSRYRPVLAMVTVVATVLWFGRPPTDSDTVSMAAAVVDAWEYDVLYSDASGDEASEWEMTAEFPDDYESIEALLKEDEGDEER